MPDYSAYIIGQDGLFMDFKIIQADDDASAVESAKGYVDGHDIEVWQLDRKIAVLPSKDKLATKDEGGTA